MKTLLVYWIPILLFLLIVKSTGDLWKTNLTSLNTLKAHPEQTQKPK